MKKPTIVLAAAAVLSGPVAGTAQVYEHVAGGIGLTANHYPGQSYGLGIGLPRHATGFAFHTGSSVSFGFGFGLGLGNPHHGYGGYLYNAYPFGFRSPRHYCRDYVWFDPFRYCGTPYGHGWFDPWWEPVVFVPSPRWHFGWYGHGWYDPFWHDPWYDRWAYHGWDPYRSHWGFRTVYYDRGYAHPRVASRSPLFGPRYKEDPRPYVYVSDNGPERPVSRAVPRGDRTAVPATEGAWRTAGRRGGEVRAEPETRTARPRVRERPGTGQGQPSSTSAQPRTPRTRSGGLVVTPGSPVRTSRPDTNREDPGTSSRPRSSRPVVVTPVPTRSARPTAGRATAPSTRRATPQAGRTTPPRVRTRPDATPSRRVTPTRASAPTRARPAPAKTVSKPKVRSAPSRSRSAPPKAGSAPPRRSPPKSSPPRRSAPPRRGN